ncbi:MAG TPA: substrate-binding domain-containing protein [Kiritimatiellia bacterium]|nr:substrate-binding domain-containing protein [Kiritimatiellia bacterium]HQA37411.1 substrate-binding domain-containing protein [Kiritimatiellia bacterium]HQQ90745.1 substrate-binding domain-containing protein [Kiritimatiellia bacterium]
MKRRKQIFFLLSWNDYRIFQGISRFAREAGWRMDTRHFFTNQIPLDGTFDGMIAMGHRDPAVNAYVRARAATVPAVILGTDSPGLDAPMVVPDNRQIARAAADHLYALFHKRTGWFACDASPSGDERKRAFRERLEELKLPFMDLSGTTPREQLHAVQSRLKSHRMPLGVMCRDDHDAVVLIERCIEAQIKVPDEVAVIGVGDLEALCAISPVPLTSVSPDMEQLGYQAAHVLDRRMRGLPVPPVTVVPPGPLVRRVSTGCLAITHPALRRAVHMIDTHYPETLTMEQIAEAAGVSLRQLFLLFRREMRGSPHRYLLDVRLEHAQKLVLANEQRVTEIAAACGFSTTRTLTRAFHQQVGMAPAKWGKKMRQPHFKPHDTAIAEKDSQKTHDLL